VKDTMALEHYLQEKWVLDDYKQLDRHALARGIKNEDLDIEELGTMIDSKESITLRVGKKKE
jgi:hypothetical protein